jgi:hypothetical protein
MAIASVALPLVEFVSPALDFMVDRNIHNVICID